MIKNFLKRSIPLDKFIGSFLLSMLILSQNFFGISEMIFHTTLPFKVLLVAGAFVAFFYFEKKFSIQQFFIFFVIFSFFVLTLIANNNDSLSELFVSFILYGCAAFIFSFCKFDEYFLYSLMTIIGLFWLGLFLLVNKMQVNDTFGFGYTLLPVVLSSFLLLTYKSKSFWIILLKALAFAVPLFFILIDGSRGPVLCAFIFGFLYFLPCVKNWKKAIIYVSILAAFIVLLVNIGAIVTFIHNLIPGKISFIDKTYLLLNSKSGYSNGRFRILQDILSQYKVSDYITGVGIGSYNSSHPEEGYTHNIFFSVILDFGLVGVFFLLYIVFAYFLFIFKNKENTRFLTLLFTLSIVTLLFSGNYWKFYTFWLFVFFSANNCFNLENVKRGLTFSRQKVVNE